MTSKSRRILGVVVVLLLVAAAGYLYLGGASETKVELVSCQTLDLVGLEYRGTPQEERLGQYFQEVEANRGEAPLYTVYFEEPSGKRDTLHVFVGMASGEGPDRLPTSWAERSFDCSEAVKASMQMHRWVMPGPQQTKKKMEDFASARGRMLQGVFIDKIIGRNHVEVWAPVRE
ncbi:hypothetical protein SAMN05192553_108107 [Cyclobacterium xiamenense]|uniref:Bacterial transcription activator effector binding domain-containing protein n=1 Tax=Cyclobacterium xiamenense TaxID=1297121 RepID=A0A1H7AT16_9BACT|nr:hypothetical protein [Cyclobacterium xiamenense]SEJ68719.1 hypothetical protein SAMN05192553_108107 [Cyclobacterium xiamenense]